MGSATKEVLQLIFPSGGIDLPQDEVDELFPEYEVRMLGIPFAAIHKVHEYYDPSTFFQDVDVLSTIFALPPSLESAPKLKYLAIMSAGLNQVYDNPFYKDSTIPITNASGVHAPQIAEWVIMTALAHSHRYNQLYEQQKEQKWASAPFVTVDDYQNRRIGILGYGSIGRQTARIAQAMGMDVIAYTASPRETPESRRDREFHVPGTGDPEGTIPSAWYSGADKKHLHEFLAQDLDVLLIAVPLLPSTTNLIGAEEFEILSKKRTFISNIARGGIVDTDALMKALEDGSISGAALDVTNPEPLPSDHPLWKSPNVFISPHVSAMSSKLRSRFLTLLRINLTNLKEEKTLVNIVDRSKGY